MNDPRDFIKSHTALASPPLVPEVRLYLASEVVALWHLTEEELEAKGIPPPYWAFAWAGGQALARFVLDNPAAVRGRRVLDFGSGSGLCAIAAAMSGASQVEASDIDPLAADAIALNAAANGQGIQVTTTDLIGSIGTWQSILLGDMFYERPLAERILTWLQDRVAKGIEVLLGDPRRSYFPKEQVERLAEYRVETTRELEDAEQRHTGVYRLKARA
ncbi:MAG: methyltransferase [Alphaproteobacteria bacterium]|nr:methyltransferase [Alphaproteobacteria bacterium]